MPNIICPSCGGKGHVFDPCCLLLVGWGWLDGIFGRNNKDALSRQPCGQCKGKGYVKIPN